MMREPDLEYLHDCKHTLIVTHWMIRDSYRSAQSYMCQHCARVWDAAEIAQRAAKIKKLEEMFAK